MLYVGYVVDRVRGHKNLNRNQRTDNLERYKTNKQPEWLITEIEGPGLEKGNIRPKAVVGGFI